MTNEIETANGGAPDTAPGIDSVAEAPATAGAPDAPETCALESALADVATDAGADSVGASADATAPQADHAGTRLELNINEGLDAGTPRIDPLIDFVINQLQPVEALGFLRGAIIWMAGGMGTDQAISTAAEKLDAFNLAFQYRLREFKIKADANMLAQHDKEVAYRKQADEDAQKRGFESSAHMQEELGNLYIDLAERLRAWHAATEPGGDVTSAPDIDRMLFDAYRIVEGLGQTERTA